MAKIMEQAGKVNFGQAIAHFFRGYFDFKGRSTRAAYWWLQLFILIILIPLLLLWVLVQALMLSSNLGYMPGSVASGPIFQFNPIFFLIVLFLLAIAIPFYALLARRFRDIGISGKWIVALLIVNVILTFEGLFAGSSQPEALQFFFFMIDFALTVAFFIFSLLPSDYFKTKNAVATANENGNIAEEPALSELKTMPENQAPINSGITPENLTSDNSEITSESLASVNPVVTQESTAAGNPKVESESVLSENSKIESVNSLSAALGTASNNSAGNSLSNSEVTTENLLSNIQKMASEMLASSATQAEAEPEGTNKAESNASETSSEASSTVPNNK